jgi:type II secretory pathway predicted ATPase ExeA
MSLYLEHFGLAEAPFKITPHTEFFFAGANRGETLEALIYAITGGEGMVKVTGEVGAGKTMLCRVLMERLPKTVETIYLAVPSLSRDEMLAVIAQDLGIAPVGISTTQLVRALQDKLIAIHAEGRQVVALIDEAHAMPLETLEQIRLLSNLETSHHKLMQIVLFGQPELDTHLSLLHMRQLKERITHSFVLMPLPPRDIKDYLNFRLRAAGYKGPDLFGAEALKLIAEASEGLTRRINIYADKTLLAAFAGGTHTITADHVRAAITDTAIVLPAESHKSQRRNLALAAMLLLGLVVGFLLGRVTTGMTTPASTIASVASRSAPAPIAAAVAAPAPLTAPQPSPESAPVRTATTLAPAPPPAINWLESRINEDRTRLVKMTGTQFTIQLMTADARDESAIEQFFRVASRDLVVDKLMLSSASGAPNARISVLYGPFVQRSDALQVMLKLPPAVARFNPYLRTVQAVRDDARAANALQTSGATSTAMRPN